MVQPPSITLKLKFAKLKGTPPASASIEDIARKVLLSHAEVSMWFEHLQTVSDNRKRGATKAAEPWRKKRQASQESSKSQTEYYCGVCQEPYMDFTDQIEKWIGWEHCNMVSFCVWGSVSEPEIFVKIVKSRCYLCYQYSFCTGFVVHGYNICMDIVVLVMKFWCFKSPSCAPG